MVRQPFHLVTPSPWPILGATSAFCIVFGLVCLFNGASSAPVIGLGVGGCVLVMYVWWRDVAREGTMQGFHTLPVLGGLKLGMLLFILSEVMFFFGFFWAFFHSSLVPSSYSLGAVWPPTGVIPINPFSVPLLNTGVLLASGFSVTLAHHYMLGGDRTGMLVSLLVTVLLGAYFTVLQGGEYVEASFSVADSVYGATFFVTTGFHGAHVLIGTTILIVCWVRCYFMQFSSEHHFGFEAGAWYWHFVDVVWIGVFISMYWWGS